MEARLAAYGGAWGWIVAYGIASILLGLIAIVWPGATLVAIAIIFSMQLIITAIFRFVLVFALPSELGWLRALTALVAVLSFVLGIYLLGHIGLTLLILATLLGIFWIAQGAIELFVAITLVLGVFLILFGATAIVRGIQPRTLSHRMGIA